MVARCLLGRMLLCVVSPVPRSRWARPGDGLCMGCLARLVSHTLFLAGRKRFAWQRWLVLILVALSYGDGGRWLRSKDAPLLP